MKFCPKCKINKSIEDYYKSSQTKSGISGWCKECHKQACMANAKRPKAKLLAKVRYSALSDKQKKLRRFAAEQSHIRYRRSAKGLAKKRANRLRVEVQARDRQSYLKKRYGITIEQYDRMVAVQDGRCAICNKHQTELPQSLAVDHCHITGQIRGLLCIACNAGIGSLRDNCVIVESALHYLKANNNSAKALGGI